MWELAERIEEVRALVRENDGRNVADSRFVQKVDGLLDIFYDDIGEIKRIDLSTLFYLFLVKCLYVNRRSTKAAVLDYLADMLNRYLWTRELFPLGLSRQQYLDMLTLVLEETKAASAFQNLFEFHRKLGDNALFLTGLFPAAINRRASSRRRWWATTPGLNRARYVDFGRRNYHLAADHELAEWTGQRPVLSKLSEHFEIYMDALSEMAERYVTGFDMSIITDKFLDSINRYRRTGEERYLDDARKYAAILKIDRGAFPKLYRRRPRFAILPDRPSPPSSPWGTGGSGLAN
ncbi:MAG: hypothetical protein M1389_11935 [Chloroflexi bacterium]|nr:hypothetical protein [Chloroflexota bacterium]